MATIIIGEIVSVRINGKWHDAEVLDVTQTGAYVYVFDLRVKRNVLFRDIR